MLTRYANELLARLERCTDIGCAEIRRGELLWWYGQDRLTVGVWRDIAEKWVEVLEQCGEQYRDISLFVGESDGVWVFVWGQGLNAGSDSWLKDVRDLAGMSAPGLNE